MTASADVGAGRTLRRITGVAAVALLIAAAPPVARAATLELTVTPLQASHTSVVRVTATGSADANPSACPPGVGCELTVFVIRSGTCPAQPSLLVSNANTVVFLTSAGLPALIGTKPGPFSATGDYFLDGAPTAGGQGNAGDGYTQSRWGTFLFCGYLQDAAASASFVNARPDELDPFGPGAVHLPVARVAVYAATCAALPCRVRVSVSAFAGGRPVPGLTGRSGESITSSPSGGPAVVSFPLAVLNRNLLGQTIARKGYVRLRFTTTITDAHGGHTTASRTITFTR
jgi:hypothetical protein